jgi:ubiquinone/menaquinone biosynthesis C-methylase UbiE
VSLRRLLLRLGFQLLYNQLAWTYDAVAWSVSLGQWASWRRCALPLLKSGPVLELAYGTGGLFADMVQRDLAPVGVDLSPYMARLARRRLRQRSPTRTSCLVQARAQALPFPTGRFANVVATFPTEYIMDKSSLVEVARVLQAPSVTGSGRLVIVTEGELVGPRPWRAFIEWLYRITGQRSIPPTGPLSRLQQLGFRARWQMVAFEGATAKIMVAEPGTI